MTKRRRKNTGKKKRKHKQTNTWNLLPDKVKIPVIKGFAQNGEKTTNAAVGFIKYTVNSASKMLGKKSDFPFF